jgi:hypothetical protein
MWEIPDAVREVELKPQRADLQRKSSAVDYFVAKATKS